MQIFEQINALAASSGLKLVLITGGADMRAQAITLASRPHVVIATPGRLADHVASSGEDTICGLRRVRFVVFDEADRLLADGAGSMLSDLDRCLAILPPPTQRQTLLFTATITDAVSELREKPRSPSRPPLEFVEISSTGPVVPTTLSQSYILVPLTQRDTYLHVLLSTPANEARTSILIFCNRTVTAAYLENTLRLLGHRVTALHSSLPQRDRTANLSRFRARAVKILVATDVASRGLDLPSVDLVINYDVPRDPADYIHRVGRTARAGRKGLSITLIGQRDVLLIQTIEERVNLKMVEYVEEGVSVSGRVAKEATLKAVGEARRETVVRMEEAKDDRGKFKVLRVRKRKHTMW
jgi:ATP-dependent RNA helicase DDX49/DBP8